MTQKNDGGPAWQPIETAPKDGTWIVVRADNAMPDVAWWHRGRWKTISHTLDWGKYRYDEWPLTHWMPLPEPPARKEPDQ